MLEQKKGECWWFNYVTGSYTALAAFQLKFKTLHSAFKVPAFADERKFRHFNAITGEFGQSLLGDVVSRKFVTPGRPFGDPSRVL